MLVNQANITEKNYRRLTLQVSLDSFSFCCTDTLNGNVLWIEEIHFPDEPGKSTESRYQEAFHNYERLSQPYDEIQVFHDNAYSSFVPQPLFDADFLGSYLQFNTKVFETDSFSYDEMPNYEMNNVFVPFSNINSVLLAKFGHFKSRHASTGLVSRILEISKNVDDRQVFAHIRKNRFDLIVVQNRKLLLFNTFEYRTKEDFLYYLLFTAEQLSLNPEQFKLHFLGQVEKDDELFAIAYKYIRNVGLLDVSDIVSRNGLSEQENRHHFTLLQ